MIAENVSIAARGALAHLLDAELEQRVDVRIARAAPHLPHRVLGEHAHDVVAVVERAQEQGRVGHRADLAQPRRGLAPLLDVRRGDVRERLLARRPGRPLRHGGRGAPGGERQGEREDGDGGGHGWPVNARNPASSSTGTPSRCASSAFDPASSPTTT
jgi:hypothetical protein